MPADYTYITTATTTVIGASAPRRVVLLGIFVNKALTGTVTIKSGSTTLGVIAASSPAGSYWVTTRGVGINDLQITTSAAEDITVATTSNVL